MEDSEHTKPCELLHAYEIGMLSDDEVSIFEAHLIECERCFEQVKNFQREAALLARDADVRKAVSVLSGSESRSADPVGARTAFWSGMSWRLGIASTALAAVLIIVVALVMTGGKAPGRTVIMGVLMPRSGPFPTVTVSDQDTLIVEFPVSRALSDSIISVSVRCVESGARIYYNDHLPLSGRAGEVELLGSSLESGKYELLMKGAADMSSGEDLTTFVIVKK